MASSGKTSAKFGKDPLTDRRDSIEAMKGFKKSKFPAKAFKDSKPRTSHDESYQPFKGGEKK